MEKQIFITGGTGFLGSNLIVDVLRQDPTAKVIALVRSDSDVKAKERLFNALPITISDINYAEILERISVVSGDVTKVHFGLSEEDFHSLAQQITHIIHSAADVRFTLSLEEARLVNVTGTKHVFELAELAKRSGQFERVAYIGTAYVSGDRSGRITENELDCNQKFSNSYEQSKFEAEKFVRSMRDRIPVTIFRPSIIVGNSETGKTNSFNVLYAPLKLINRNLLSILPGSKNTPMDIVPIDYVTQAICHIMFRLNIGIG